MEYKRKNRWANYNSDKCRVYLRNDFSHECAYCKLQEREVGLIDAKFFEIDHFRPQSDDDKSFNHDLYNNLYYSCAECNGKKSDTWSEELLNPCEDDIFLGKCPPVIGGYNPETLYKYESTNSKGIFYINTFQLNSIHHTRIRKRRVNRENNIKIIDKLVEEILLKFSAKKKNNDLEESIKQLDELRATKKQEIKELSSDVNFELAVGHLGKHNIKNSVVFEEYNMDIKIKVEDVSYYCELIVDISEDDKDEKIKFIDKKRLQTWYEKLTYKFGILYYYPKLDKLYFYRISDIITEKELNTFGSKKRIKLTNDFLI